MGRVQQVQVIASSEWEAKYKAVEGVTNTVPDFAGLISSRVVDNPAPVVWMIEVTYKSNLSTSVPAGSVATLCPSCGSRATPILMGRDLSATGTGIECARCDKRFPERVGDQGPKFKLEELRK